MFTIAERGTSSDRGFEAWSFQPDQIPAAWEELEPFVLDALHYAKGELSVEDVKKFLLQGYFAAFALAKEGRIQLVMITELCNWPQYSSVRVLAMAGNNFDAAKQFLSAFEAWVLSKGAVEIEAWCRPEMSRLLRRLGFLKAYEIVRLDLRSKLQ
jgi:hypothetical protein